MAREYYVVMTLAGSVVPSSAVFHGTEGQTMTTSTTTPRIYVACLAAYNAGKPHGTWIDVQGKDAEQIMEEVIARVLLTSPAPNVTRCLDCHALQNADGNWGPIQKPNFLTCDPHRPRPASEEWAIHDYEGFQGIKVSEFASFEGVAALASLLEEHAGPVIQAAIDDLGDATVDARRVQDWIADRYQGEWDSLEDYAESYLEDTGFFPSSAPDHARRNPDQARMDTMRAYFDFERYARDLELGGDVFTVQAPNGKVYVFSGH